MKLIVRLPVYPDHRCPDWGTHYPHLHGKGVCPGAGAAKEVDVYRLRGMGSSFLVVDRSDRITKRTAEATGTTVYLLGEDEWTWEEMTIQGVRLFCGVYAPHRPHRTSDLEYCPGWSGQGLLVGEIVYQVQPGHVSRFVVGKKFETPPNGEKFE